MNLFWYLLGLGRRRRRRLDLNRFCAIEHGRTWRHVASEKTRDARAETQRDDSFEKHFVFSDPPKRCNCIGKRYDCIILKTSQEITPLDKAEPIWRPDPDRAANSRLAEFMRVVRERGVRADDYPELWRWSVDESADFWSTVFDFCNVIGSRCTGPALQDAEAMPGARWFDGTMLNFAENLLAGAGEEVAIIARDESGFRRQLTRKQLAEEVARVADGLRSCGVGSGDRIAGYLPNIPETAIAMLATASLGAIWTSCSPDFGTQGVIDRFGQVEPKVLFACEGVRYGGKYVDCRGRIADLAEALPSLEKIVLVAAEGIAPDQTSNAAACRFESFGQSGTTLEFHQFPFSHPLFVLYSSGTTGIPKCIVHGAGGTLLQHLKEHQLHTDVQPGDRLFFFTTCGWMMWNWLVSALASRATIVLYDGSPTFPDESALWRMAEEEKIDIFGTSPKYLAALEKSGYRPTERHELDRLRTVLCTGSPLAPEQYDFVSDAIGAHLQLSSISGGTDIVSCFALGNPLLPVHRGEIQCLGLGLNVEVWDEQGNAVVDQRGELVCSAPFPCMPIGFWKDDGRKYRAAYFERFPGVWHHGDYAVLTSRGSLVILGRSDAVLNPGGIRIGTAEIYRQVEGLEEVLESVVIGQDWDNDVRIVLFVRLREGLVLDDSLVAKIRSTIRTNTTPRHVPDRILQVPEVPRTISGKVVELTVRNVVHGQPVTNVEALANPHALEHFRGRPELRR